METTSSPASSTQPTTNKNATNIEACFSTGLDLSDFGGNIQSSATVNISASAALAKIKSDAAARMRREEQEEAALERRVAAVDKVILPANDGSNNTDSKDVIPRALHPNSQSSSMAGEDRNSNFIQFQSAGGNYDNNFLSSLVTTHKTEGREISNKSRLMLKSNSKVKAKLGQRIDSGRRPRQTHNNMKQKLSGKSVVKKSFKSKV